MDFFLGDFDDFVDYRYDDGYSIIRYHRRRVCTSNADKILDSMLNGPSRLMLPTLASPCRSAVNSPGRSPTAQCYYEGEYVYYRVRRRCKSPTPRVLQDTENRKGSEDVKTGVYQSKTSNGLKVRVKCSQCLCQIDADGAIYTACGHVFCEKCIWRTFCLTKKCPRCQTPLKRHPSDQYYLDYLE